MAHYALQAAYTPLGWAALLKDPQHRLEAITPVIERLGGTVVTGWLMFGDYDLLVICELPDNVRLDEHAPVVRDRLKRAGVRLAALLDGALGGGDGAPGEAAAVAIVALLPNPQGEDPGRERVTLISEQGQLAVLVELLVA